MVATAYFWVSTPPNQLGAKRVRNHFIRVREEFK